MLPFTRLTPHRVMPVDGQLPAVPVLCTVLGDFEVVGATYLFEASARQSGKKSAE